MKPDIQAISTEQIATSEQTLLRLYDYINREMFNNAKPMPQKILFREDDEDKLIIETVTIYKPHNQEALQSIELIVPRRWIYSASGASHIILDFLKKMR